MWNRIKEIFTEFIKKRYTKEQVIRLFVAATIFIFICLIFGCSSKQSTTYYPIYKEVNIPVKCSQEIPKKPAFVGDTVIDNLNILKYSEKLKAVLIACIN